jgi:hypothetical protein
VAVTVSSRCAGEQAAFFIWVLLRYLQMTVSCSFVPIEWLQSPITFSEVIDEIYIYLISYLEKYDT